MNAKKNQDNFTFALKYAVAKVNQTCNMKQIVVVYKDTKTNLAARIDEPG
jgi:hypothetical protein